MKTALWWIRDDLRLGDNPALASALEQAETVIPVFLLDPKLLASPYAGEKRIAFLFAGLRLLDADLRQRGSALIVRQGDPLEALERLKAETRAEGIFAQAGLTPYAGRRDERVKRRLPLALVSGHTIFPPEMLLKPNGSPYTVFTPFSRMWRSLPFPGAPLPAPERLPALPPLASLEIPASPSHPSDSSFPAGEAEAQRRLRAFTESGIQRYSQVRDRMDLEGTSQLSPYLRFGMISARQAAFTARQASLKPGAEKGAESWLNELIWREFYAAILYHFPHARKMAFRSDLRQILWQDDPTGFEAWAEGRTGYPIVDAAMHQLNKTGWMHNRARMIAASFLVKDLLIDWRKGERCFMERLLDGDPASNNGGWQWVAGTGTDAAPYFRVFNPVLQGKKFDPQGDYVRRWLPELAVVPDQYIHEPWKMPLSLQRQAGCLIGKDYPATIIDHAFARQRMLTAYKQKETYGKL